MQSLVLAINGTTKGHRRSFLALRVGGIKDGEEWSVTVGVVEMVEGKTAKEQVRAIIELWEDIKSRQVRMGERVKEIYHIHGITFDNSADNRGVKGGVWVELNRAREEKACEHGCTCKPLVEKGCGDHIMALCMKGWEREIARLAKDWKATHLLPPADTKSYLNRFTSTMKRLSRRFVDGPWAGIWQGFVRLLDERPTPVDRVTRVRFVSTDQMARHAYKWYTHTHNHLPNHHLTHQARYPYFYLWYAGLEPVLTEKDREDFAALTNPDIFHLMKISAIGLEVSPFDLHTNMVHHKSISWFLW